MDESYYREENVRRLFYNKILFITRLPEKFLRYKGLLNEHLDDIQKQENFVNYNDWHLYTKCVEVPDVVDGNKGYVYIRLDIMCKDDEDRKLILGDDSGEETTFNTIVKKNDLLKNYLK